MMRLQLVTNISLKTVALPCLLLLTCFELAQHSTNGAVTISPSPKATVCNVGDSLEVTCNITSNVLTWILSYSSDNGMVEQHSEIITSTLMTQPTVRLESSVITFMRRSESRPTGPLVSSVVIDSVSLSLNGTRIICMEFSSTSEMTTMIFIAPYSAYNLVDSLNVTVENKEFRADGVSLNLHLLIHDNAAGSPVSFNVSTTPVTEPILISVTSASLTVAYNTFYNVSVVTTVGDGVCDRVRVSLIHLHYTKCEHPLDQSQMAVHDREIDDFLIVTGYTDPAIEGSSVNLSCSYGVITGPTMTTCMQNGEWEPNPANVECEVTCGHPFCDKASDSIIIMGYVDPGMEGATITLVCLSQYALIGPNTTTCMRNGEWEPDPREVECKAAGFEGEKVGESKSTNVLTVIVSSMVLSFLIISLLIFITGFVCGHYFGRKYKQPPSSLINQPVALYEDVSVLPSAVQHQEQHLELKENVAYGPLNQ